MFLKTTQFQKLSYNLPVNLMLFVRWLVLPTIAAGIFFEFHINHKIPTIVACTLIALLMMIPAKKRGIDLAARSNDTVQDFARSFDVRLVNTWVIRAVYEELCHYCAHPVWATDRCDEDLHIEMNDLQIMVRRLAQRTDRVLNEFDVSDLKTVDELVYFLNQLKKGS